MNQEKFKLEERASIAHTIQQPNIFQLYFYALCSIKRSISFVAFLTKQKVTEKWEMDKEACK